VAVSSRVANPRDLPEHLVDRREETAWNGKTGDLVGGWLAFRVPKAAHVSHVLVSAGFDKVSAKKEDLFTANVRIARVRLKKGDTVLREAALDPSVRTPQRIDVDQSGGDFTLEVLEVVPGTHAGWRELTVSELVVMGTPGKSVHKKPTAPLVRVGSLDDDVDPATLATEASKEAACATFVKSSKEALDDDKGQTWWGGDTPEAPTCLMGVTTVAPPDGDALEVTTAAVEVVQPGAYHMAFHGELLAVRTKKATHLTDLRVSGDETAMFWKIHYERIASEWVKTPKGPLLVLQVVRTRVTDSDGYAEDPADLHSEEVVHVGIVCEIDASGPHCTSDETVVGADASRKVLPVRTRAGDDGSVVFDVPR
jgi:hypothetical protein